MNSLTDVTDTGQASLALEDATPFECSSKDVVGEIAEKIFTIEREHILPLIKPLLPEAEEKPDFTLLIDLFKRIYSDNEQGESIVKEITNAIAEHPSFPDFLNAAISAEPLLFIRMVVHLKKEIKFNILSPVLLLEKEAAYANFMGCLRMFLLPFWKDNDDRSETLDKFLRVLDQEQFEGVVSTAVANFSLKDLGRLLAITEDQETAVDFIYFLTQKHLDTEGFEEVLVQFIESIVEEADKAEDKYRPEILLELLVYENSYQRLCPIITDLSDRLSPKALSYVLWCLPERELKRFLKDYSVEENCPELLGWLNQLIELECSYERRLDFMHLFLRELEEEELQLFLTNMLIGNSKGIPYLCPGLQEDAFSVFALVFGADLRSNLLRNALTPSVKINRKIVYSLCRSNRRHALCNLARLDIVSQELVKVGSEQFGKMAALKDFSDYIAEGMVSHDLEDKMAKTEKDYRRLPPLLLALAMTDDTLRPQYIATLRYMTDDQLVAFAQQVPEDREVEIIDLMMSKASIDQMEKILGDVPFSTLENYLREKSGEIQKQFHAISEMHEKIKVGVEKLSQPKASEQEGYKEFHAEVLNECRILDGFLRGIFSPVNRMIRKHAKEVFEDYEVDKPEDFSRIVNMMRFCELMNESLNGAEGYFKTLDKLDPQEEKEETPLRDFDTNKIPPVFRNDNKIDENTLKGIGIVYEKDLEYLGISLESKVILNARDLETLKAYIGQSEFLVKFWTFFKDKKLCTICDLFTAMIVDKPEDLLELENLARQMGYKD